MRKILTALIFVGLSSVFLFSCSNPEYDDSEVKMEIKKLKEENEFQNKRLEELEKLAENFCILQNQMILTNSSLEELTTRFETQVSEYDSNLLESIKSFQETLTADYVNFQKNISLAFQNNETILNKSVEELTADLKQLEKMIKEDRRIDDLKDYTNNLANQIALLKQVDLIEISESGDALFWSVDKKLLKCGNVIFKYDSDGIIQSLYYKDDSSYNRYAVFYENGIYCDTDQTGKRVTENFRQFYCTKCNNKKIYCKYALDFHIYDDMHQYSSECIPNLSYDIDEGSIKSRSCFVFGFRGIVESNFLCEELRHKYQIEFYSKDGRGEIYIK